MNIQKQRRGFSLVELLVTLGLIAIISAIATPSFLTWRDNYKLKAAAREINSILQKIRTEAIKRNTSISIVFTDNGYTAFIDDGGDGSGGAAAVENFTLDSNETELISGTVATGISLETSMSSSSESTGYTSKGLALKQRIGNVTISSDFTTRKFKVVISSAGHTKITEG